MKAERRHELKENALAKQLVQAPDFFREHSAKLSLAGVLLIAVIAALLFRWRSENEQYAQAKQNLANAQQQLDMLKQLDFGKLREVDPVALAAQRSSSYKSGLDATDLVLTLTSTSSKDIRAAAYIMKGDLNWWLAHLTPVSGAETQPSLRPEQTPTQLLTAAEDAYTAVLNQYADQELQVVAARLGLAAVDQERIGLGDSNALELAAKAKEQLNAIITDGKCPVTLTILAQTELSQLPDQLLTPLANISPPATRPATRPSTEPSWAATQPSTLPAWESPEPTTLPTLPRLPSTRRLPGLPSLPHEGHKITD